MTGTELKNSKSTFSDFSVILSMTKKSYFLGDGNRALSRDSQLLHLLLAAAAAAAAAAGVESRERGESALSHSFRSSHLAALQFYS